MARNILEWELKESITIELEIEVNPKYKYDMLKVACSEIFIRVSTFYVLQSQWVYKSVI